MIKKKLSYKELEKELLSLKNINIKSSRDDQYKELFDSMTEMVEIIELVYNKNGKAIDFYIRDVNISFAKLLGKTKEQLINKKISSVVGTIEDNWFTYFSNVDKTGITHSFKNYGVAFDKYYFVTAWKVSENRVGISFIDITKTEKHEIELKRSLEKERNKAQDILKEKRTGLNKTIDKLGNINSELAFKKEGLLDELAIVKNEKAARVDELVHIKKELAFKNEEKDGLLDKLVHAKKKLVLESEKKEDLLDELVVVKEEKAARVDELVNAKEELVLESEKKDELLDELVIAKKEKVKRVDELALAKEELAFQKEIEGYHSEMESVAQDLTLLIDTANAPIFGIDSKGLVDEWNQTSEKITGFTKGEVLGKDLVQTYITEDYRKSVKKVLDNALKGKETANYKFPLFAKNGELVMVLLNSSTRRNAAGEITGVLGVGQDITELTIQNEEKEKRAKELALANLELAIQNEEKDKRAEELALAKELRRFIQTANTPIFGIDSIGFINEWNQAAEEITGYKKSEVLGLNWIKFTPINSEEGAKKVLIDALKGKQTSNFEFITSAKNGQEVILLVNTSTRRDTSGKITGVLGVGQDITELVGYRNELEVKVDQRTIKLNEALEKQKESNELKSRFVSTASHEFRTPLSAINFAAGSIKKYWDKMKPNMIEKKLTKIEDQVALMTLLLDDILIVGQAEAGKIKNNPLSVSLGNFISEIIEEVYHSSKKSHKIVLIDTEKLTGGDIFIDEKLGRNIFINLLSNAIKFSPEAKKVIVELSSEKKYLIISIIDYGIGIPESEFKNIFMPFTRGENVDLIQGTGLGLSIVKEAVAQIKGKVSVKSSIENGTSFTVKVPKI